PRTNITTGTRYLRYLLDLFPGQLELALAAYNAGEGAVQRAGNKVPNYRETQNYVKTVMQLYIMLKPPAMTPGIKGLSPGRLRVVLPCIPSDRIYGPAMTMGGVCVAPVRGACTMTPAPAGPEELVALGVCAGVQVLVVCFSVIFANDYRERAMLLLGAATMMGVLAVQTLVGGHPFLAEAAVLLVLAVDGMQLRDLVSHAGALRQPRRWLVAVSVAVLPALALAGYLGRWHLLLPALAIWMSAVVVIMIRAWPQSQPWARWLVPGQLALAAGAGWLGWRSLDAEPDPALPLSALLSLWSVALFLANSWRSRIFSETRVRIDARTTIDPLTGLST